MEEKYICMDCGGHNVAKKELRKFQCPKCGQMGEYSWPIEPIVDSKGIKAGIKARVHFCPRCVSRTEDVSWKSN